MNAFGGISVAGGSTAQTLSTSAALMTAWNTSAGSNQTSSGDDGDPAVKPDKANNRIKLNTPGVYLVSLFLGGTIDAAQAIIARVRVNGTAKGDLVVKQKWTDSIENHMHLTGLVEVTRADAPGTLATMADASTSGFSGAAGAPKTEVALDVTLEAGASTPAVTVTQANLTVIRLK